MPGFARERAEQCSSAGLDTTATVSNGFPGQPLCELQTKSFPRNSRRISCFCVIVGEGHGGFFCN